MADTALLQSTYLAQRNATELAWDFTEDQFFQTVYSCDDVPYYSNSTGEPQHVRTSPSAVACTCCIN